MFRLRLTSFCLVLSLLAASSATRAQGLLVDMSPERHVPLPRPIVQPDPATGYKISSIDVTARITDQIAKVQVAQTFQNTGSRQMEVSFVFPLPYDGAIDKLTLMVDGKEYEAKLLPADEARQMYEAIVRKNKDPALLEWMGTGLFKTSVFPVPAGAKRTVTLRYTQLCRKSKGLTDFLFPLRTARYTTGPLDSLKISVAIDSNEPIKNVYSALHAVDVKRNGARNALVTYEATDKIPADDFRLFYDATPQGVGASVVSYRPNSNEPGYFLLLATPEIESTSVERPTKTVVFVVDRSGSMSGKKMEQTKRAVKFVLNNLREGDTFNIVAYDSNIETFRPELEKFNEQNRQAALGFVEGLFAGGSTNISGALDRTFSMLEDSSRPTYVMFMTDGLPTAGETKEAKIVDLASAANRVRARMFTFGVGYDVNSRLLDRLVAANFGQSEYVRPNEDIEAAVSKLYRRIGTPVLTDVQLNFDIDAATAADGAIVTRIYPAGTFDLFAGDQAVIVGRYSKPGAAKVRLSGAVGGKEQAYEFPAKLTDSSSDDTNAFIAKLWAARRVGEIIDEMDLNGRNEELINELVLLATKHGILTQYTSFMADENSDFNAVADNSMRSLELAEESLVELDGEFGFNQRFAKSNYREAKQAGAGELGGFGGGGFGPAAPAQKAELSRGVARGNAVYFDSKSNRGEIATNILKRGRKTFFRQGEQWVDSSLTEEEQKRVNNIKRYSRAYFDLVAQHGDHVAQYLAIDEPVMVELDGNVYAW